MIVYFDASVLLAAVIEEEEHHSAALKALGRAAERFTSTHALAETFSTLTSGRLEMQLTPVDASRVIEASFVGHLQILDLTLADYQSAMRASQAVGARGGAIYDLLHLQAARRCKAARILTVNLRHFQIFAPDLKEIIALP